MKEIRYILFRFGLEIQRLLKKVVRFVKGVAASIWKLTILGFIVEYFSKVKLTPRDNMLLAIVGLISWLVSIYCDRILYKLDADIG